MFGMPPPRGLLPPPPPPMLETEPPPMTFGGKVYTVGVVVGGRQFNGQGPNYQAAKSNAASQVSV